MGQPINAAYRRQWQGEGAELAGDVTVRCRVKGGREFEVRRVRVWLRAGSRRRVRQPADQRLVEWAFISSINMPEGVQLGPRGALASSPLRNLMASTMVSYKGTTTRFRFQWHLRDIIRGLDGQTQFHTFPQCRWTAVLPNSLDDNDALH